MHREDLALARRVVARDRRAAELFFEEYFARLYRFVSRRIDESACEDIVQESMIKALRSLAGYRGEAALFTWLCQIARHEISNYLARHRRQALVSLDDDPHVRAAIESLDMGALQEDERLAVEQIVQLTLDYLPERYSRALEWKYLEGLSVEEIARRSSTGVIAVQSLLARARNMFRQVYSEIATELEVAG